MLELEPHDDLVTPIQQLGPCTSGAKTAEQAVFAAKLARQALGTDWVKLEIHPDPNYLLPDPVETLTAAEQLVKQGFVVLPYCGADPVLCKRLEEAGCAAVMPLGAPIGSNRGLISRDFLQIIVEQAQVPVIIDAGIGAPSHAAEALEMGADAVLDEYGHCHCRGSSGDGRSLQNWRVIRAVRPGSGRQASGARRLPVQ